MHDLLDDVARIKSNARHIGFTFAARSAQFMIQNSKKPSFKAWLAAARLRTLPLALATILLGSFLAHEQFDWLILFWCVVTATSYQVLSNFANDLGDGLKGTDANRVGEKRAVASGSITIQDMRRAVVFFTIISLFSGTFLSIIATDGWLTFLFIGLGMLATWAALYYTIGNNAYGYSGWGDLFVLVFFGWVGVVGSNFLYTNQWNPDILLPATAAGFLATGVLNLNNMRDVENDTRAGKNTLVVKIGLKNARIYHVILLLGAFCMHAIYLFKNEMPAPAYLAFGAFPLAMVNIFKVFKAQSAAQLDPLLKPLAITTLLFCILAGLGVVLS